MILRWSAGACVLACAETHNLQQCDGNDAKSKSHVMYLEQGVGTWIAGVLLTWTPAFHGDMEMGRQSPVYGPAYDVASAACVKHVTSAARESPALSKTKVTPTKPYNIFIDHSLRYPLRPLPLLHQLPLVLERLQVCGHSISQELEVRASVSASVYLGGSVWAALIQVRWDLDICRVRRQFPEVGGCALLGGSLIGEETVPVFRVTVCLCIQLSHTHTHTHIYIYMYICIYTYIYICI